MENEERANILVSWLRELMHGRTRPDNKGSAGIVRDAKDYMGYISGINKELANILNVKEEKDEERG